MILYFLRHELAEDAREWQGEDAERPLTKKGKKRLQATAQALLQLKLGIQLILSSPRVRAFQTAAGVAKVLDLETELLIEERLEPDFNLNALAAILRDYPQSETLLLVGHEPSLSETIADLTGGQVVLKKGGLARVDLNPDNPLQGRLVWLLPPKLLAR